MMKIDAVDRKILKLLQKDATLSVDKISKKVGISRTPCWRRIQVLESSGLIKGRVALLDPIKLGLGMAVFVAIKCRQHDYNFMDKFVYSIQNDFPEVVGFYRMAGEVDYMLHAVLADTTAYDRLYKSIIKYEGISKVTAYISMETLKETTQLPLTEI